MDPKILVEYINDVTVVTLTDERILEEAAIQALEDSLLPLIDENSGLHLVLNFKEVKFLSSAVLGLLIRVSKKVTESQGQLRLCNIDRKILDIFRITRLDKVFEIISDSEEAVGSFD